MVKATVRDDCDAKYASRADRYKPVAASIDGDCDYEREPSPWLIGMPGGDPGTGGSPGTGDPAAGGPILAVWLRRRTGYNDDGAPLYEWQWAVTSRAIMYEERQEFDRQAGHTLQKAKAVIVYLGSGTVVVPDQDEQVEFGLHETMTVQNLTTRDWYNVTSYAKIDDRLEIEMQRIDQE